MAETPRWFEKLLDRMRGCCKQRLTPQQLADAIVAAPNVAAFLELMRLPGAATSAGVRRRFEEIAAAHKASILETRYAQVRERYPEHSSQVQRMYYAALFLDERQPLQATLAADFSLACDYRRAYMDANTLTEVPKIRDYELLQRQYQGMVNHAGTLAPELGALLKQRLDHHFTPLGSFR